MPKVEESDPSSDQDSLSDQLGKNRNVDKVNLEFESESQISARQETPSKASESSAREIVDKISHRLNDNQSKSEHETF